MSKQTSSRQKWAIAALGVVCAAALARLLWSSGVLGAGSSVRSSTPVAPVAQTRPANRPSSGTSARTTEADDLARYNPELRLGLLDQLETRPLATFERNPFQYGVTQEEKVKIAEAQKPQPPPPPAPPPPPPPVNLMAIGYSEGAGGAKKVIIQECAQVPCPNTSANASGGDMPSYEVAEGENFANRYKVLKITETSVEIEDETYHRTVQLPYPQ